MPSRVLLPLLIPALLLAIFRLDLPAITNDEAIYARWSMLSWPELIEALRTNNYPPLYFLYLRAWAALFGIEPIPFRLSSLPWWLASLWVGHALFGRTNPEQAYAALLLLAYAPVVLMQARLAKYFMPVQFLFLASLLMLHRLLAESRRWWEVVLWCAAMLALIWIHYIGAVLWISTGLWLLWVAWRSHQRWPLMLLAALFATALLYVPWLPVLLDRLGQGNLKAPAVEQGLLTRVVAPFAYTAYVFAVGHTIEPARFVVAGVGFLCFWIPLLAGLRRFRESSFLLFHAVVTGLLGAAMILRFLPTLPVLAVADRLAYVLPLLLPTLVLGWSAWPRFVRWFSGTVYLSIIAFSLFNLAGNRENVQWEFLIPWSAIEQRIERHPAPRLVVVDSWHAGSRGWYYLRDSGEHFEELRPLAAQGLIGDLASRAQASGATVFYVRSVRDSSPDGQTERLTEELTTGFGAPETTPLVDDSPAMLRLKRLLRRGAATDTHPFKMRLEIYDPPLNR